MGWAEAGAPWTEERVARLREMWTAGRTASEVAATLGGVTRSAVLGKVVRLGLGRRAPPEPRPRKAPKLYVVECHSFPFQPITLPRYATLDEAREVATKRLPAYDRIVIYRGTVEVETLDGLRARPDGGGDRRRHNGGWRDADHLLRALTARSAA